MKRKKFDPKEMEGIFIRYPNDTKGYKVRLKNKNKTIISRNGVFLDESEPN